MVAILLKWVNVSVRISSLIQINEGEGDDDGDDDAGAVLVGR